MEGNNNETTTKMKKIFVGGLAWETQRDTMTHYFQQFGDIIEAVVITDKITGRSKGYGFVTFKEAEAAISACKNMNPVIDGRRANCNLACLGSQKPPPSTTTSPRHHHHGSRRFRSQLGGGGVGIVAPSPYQFHGSSSSSAFVHQQQHNTGQFSFPYGFSGYSQEGMYPMNYYNLYGGQQYTPYIGPSQSTGMFHGYYPFYPHQYNAPQSSNNPQAQAHHQGFTFQYTTPPTPPTMLQYPYLPPHHHQQQFNSQPPPPPILSLPTSLALSLQYSSASSSSSTKATTTTTTKTVVITTTAAKAGAETSNKDGQEAIKSSIKIEDP
ncbi:unnamed protein product [Cochlearia groenlandica]